MPFVLYPHHHVKIWLSRSQDSFLPIKNQLRLVTMRTRNPTDDIYFIYDSRLLSPKALSELIHFGKTQKLHLKDIATELVAYYQCMPIDYHEKQHTEFELEKQLFACYQNEIDHVNQGGNMAAASDLLRWLKPIYTLGIYSDFDVIINTSTLPEAITVHHSLLLNIGSAIHAHTGNSIMINNDLIAVVDAVHAYPLIQRIQTRFIQACTTQLPLKPSFFSTCLSADDRGRFYEIIEECSRGKDIVQLRREIIQKTSCTRTFINWYVFLNRFHVDWYNIKRFAAFAKIQLQTTQLQQQLPRHMKANFEKLPQWSDEKLVDVYRLAIQHLLLKRIVTETTGPSHLFYIIFDFKKIGNFAYLEKEAHARSFVNPKYGLLLAFETPHQYRIKMTDEEHHRILYAKQTRPTDLSWLETGWQKMMREEAAILRATITLQRFFRTHHSPHKQTQPIPIHKKTLLSLV